MEEAGQLKTAATVGGGREWGIFGMSNARF